MEYASTRFVASSIVVAPPTAAAIALASANRSPRGASVTWLGAEGAAPAAVSSRL